MSRWPELAAKVDAFFARVEARHGADLRCGSGCADCCHVELTITEVEAGAIANEVAAWSSERRARLAAQLAAAPIAAATPTGERCAALDAGDRCAIYAARPLVCRSHGAPIRIHERGLPVIQACFRNFTAHGPEAAAADCVLDQATLSAMLLAVDRDAGGDGSRIPLRDAITRALAV